MSNQQGLRYYNTRIEDYNHIGIAESPYYPAVVPSQNRQIIEDYPSDRGHGKRDKKWSFSNLFRRKKKDNYSDSSSDEEDKKSGFLGKKRTGRKKNGTLKGGTFDHVVVPPSQRVLSPKPVIYPTERTLCNVVPAQNDVCPKNSAGSYESLQSSGNCNGKRSTSRSSCASTSLDSFGRRSRRGLAKARVEARRDTLKTESSSEDDGSQLSQSSSSIQKKCRSNDSLAATGNGKRSRDSSATRNSSAQGQKSRSARTERYIQRRSSKESLTKDTTAYPGVKEGHYYYSPPPLVPYTVQIAPLKHEPPPPPPRDPQRRLIIGQVGENGRPVSYSFETEQGQEQPLGSTNSMKKQCGSTTSVHSYNSDYIGYGNRCPQAHSGRESTPFRSSSVNSEPIRRYIKRHPMGEAQNSNETCNGNDKYNYFADHLPRSRRPIIIQASNLPENKYLSDSQIVTRAASNPAKVPWRANRNIDTFRVQCTKEEDGLVSTVALKSPQPPRPNLVYSKSEEKEVFKPSLNFTKSPEPVGDVACKRLAYSKSVEVPASKKDVPLFGGRRPTLIYSKSEESRKEKETSPSTIKKVPMQEERRTSSNLEDALNELEAIYNSLRLGDEDLLDRAEQQEIQSRLQEKTAEGLSNLSKKSCLGGSMSDSGFDFDYTDRPGRFKRPILKSTVGISKKTSDDMAERKLQQTQPIPAVAELEKGLTQISYLLASPVHNSIDAFCANPDPQREEPDITLDDVVFRNIKHINNTLKVAEPQPPFGIPLGPISAAPNSDYLHAVPNADKPRYNFKPNKIPDVVTDDLAYRTLRKDGPKDLTSLTADDYLNNNQKKFSGSFLAGYNAGKKHRAVRSLSANIYNLLHNNSDDDVMEKALEKAKSITDMKEDWLKNFSMDNNFDFSKEVVEDVHEKVPAQKLYTPLYTTDVVVNCKPPSGLVVKPSSKRATPSPVPRQNEVSEQAQKQEELITVVAEHAKLCEKLLECVIESTELIAPKKAVTEYVEDPDEEEELEELKDLVEATAPPSLATVTESAESRMATLEVEPITQEMLSEAEEHDYENIANDTEETEQKSVADVVKDDREAEMSSSEATGTMTPPSSAEGSVEREVKMAENDVQSKNRAEAPKDDEAASLGEPEQACSLQFLEIFQQNAQASVDFAPSHASDLRDDNEAEILERLISSILEETHSSNSSLSLDLEEPTDESQSEACNFSPIPPPSPYNRLETISEESLPKDDLKSSNINSSALSRDSAESSRHKHPVNDFPIPSNSERRAEVPSAWYRQEPNQFISICVQTACDVFQNIDVVALLGLLLAIVSVIVCFVK